MTKIRLWRYASPNALEAIEVGSRLLGFDLVMIERVDRYHPINDPQPGWEVVLESKDDQDMEVIDNG